MYYILHYPFHRRHQLHPSNKPTTASEEGREPLKGKLPDSAFQLRKQNSSPRAKNVIISLNQFSSKSISDPDNSIIYMPTTISENFTADLLENHNPSSSIPSHNFTFVIRSISSGHVITLLDGQVVLAPPGGRGSIHWKPKASSVSGIAFRISFCVTIRMGD